MMPRDKDGVVDTHLQVYGTNNIRVADLSIIPIHFAAHPLGKRLHLLRVNFLLMLYIFQVLYTLSLSMVSMVVFDIAELT